MWTPTTRKQHSRPAARYQTDLTDAEWGLIEGHLPAAQNKGRPRAWPMREIINAIFYVLRGGIAWRLLPSDFPPWPTVYRWFAAFRDGCVFEKINHALVMADRERAGRDASPTAAIIDSQSVKTTESGGIRGYDAGKKTKGRKRHIIVDTLGLMVGLMVHGADIQDRDGAPDLLKSIRHRWPWLLHVFADGGYAGDKLKRRLKKIGRWTVEIIKRSDKAKGFEVLPRRWVVERTFAWLGRCRRLAKDVEKSIASSEAWIIIAHIRLITRRLARYGYR